MAIQINGDGTITGISVGGLPNGIVDTDMLAANAVSSAKLASGAVTAGTMPSGSILQVVNTNKQDLWGVDITSNNTVNGITALDTTITTLSANSKILVSCQIFSEGNADDHIYALGWQRGIGGTFTTFMGGNAGGTNRHSVNTMQALGYHASDQDSTPSSTSISPMIDTPNQSAGTAITYRVGFTIGSGATKYIRGNRSFGDTNSADYERGASWMTVMEIKA